MQSYLIKHQKLLIFVGVIAALYVIYKIIYPIYSWNQKLTVEVETPEGIVSGSSVVKFTFENTIRIGSIGGSNSSVEGEATIVALPEGRFLFVLLGRPGAMAEVSYKEAILGNPDARIKDIKRYHSKIEDIRERVPLDRSSYPLFVTFDDINDLTSVRVVDPNDLTATFGEGYGLKHITIEVVDENVTNGEIKKVLKWIYSVDSLIPRSKYPRYLKDRRPEHNVNLTDFIDGKTLFNTKKDVK